MKSRLNKSIAALSIAGCFTATQVTTAQSNSTHDDVMKSFAQEYKAQQEEYKAAYDAIFKEYEDHNRAIRAEYDEYCRAIKALWGDRDVVESEPKQWVEYSDDLQERSVVDFESGEVTVEVLVDPDQVTNGAAITQKLQDAVEQLVTSKGKTINYNSKYEAPKSVTDSPILGSQIDLGGYVDKLASAGETAKAIALKAKRTITEKLNGLGEKKAVVAINLELNTNHISERAAKYSATISRAAKKYAIEEALIYSIMEQESSFNAMAKSPIPAYGLMQLVPTTGGRDSYNYVYKRDVIPSSSFLYDAENNIELGTAYLRIVKDRHFSSVTNPKSQRLCMIASYNAGAGGLSRAINGTTNIAKAIPSINSMSYEALYAKLRRTLPKETQGYIHKVTNNYSKYTSMQ